MSEDVLDVLNIIIALDFERHVLRALASFTAGVTAAEVSRAMDGPGDGRTVQGALHRAVTSGYAASAELRRSGRTIRTLYLVTDAGRAEAGKAGGES